jgi:hypothetical protein
MRFPGHTSRTATRVNEPRKFTKEIIPRSDGDRPTRTTPTCRGNTRNAGPKKREAPGYVWESGQVQAQRLDGHHG